MMEPAGKTPALVIEGLRRVITERLGDLLLSSGGIARLLSPLVGSLVGGWLLFRFFPDAAAAALQTRVALILNNGVIRMRTVVGKFFCCGRLARRRRRAGPRRPFGPDRRRHRILPRTPPRALEKDVQAMVPVGAAAALAAAFNTPMAAVLFTLEELLGDLNARVLGSVVIGAATSWMVLHLSWATRRCSSVRPINSSIRRSSCLRPAGRARRPGLGRVHRSCSGCARTIVVCPLDRRLPAGHGRTRGRPAGAL